MAQQLLAGVCGKSNLFRVSSRFASGRCRTSSHPLQCPYEHGLPAQPWPTLVPWFWARRRSQAPPQTLRIIRKVTALRLAKGRRRCRENLSIGGTSPRSAPHRFGKGADEDTRYIVDIRAQHLRTHRFALAASQAPRRPVRYEHQLRDGGETEAAVLELAL